MSRQIRGKAADRDIAITMVDMIDPGNIAGALNVQTYSRRLFGKFAVQLRNKIQCHILGNREAKGPVRGAGLKFAVTVHHLFDLAQGPAYRDVQFNGTGRRRHVALGTDEKLIVEQPPQSRERIAHGGLAQADRLAGARHMAVFHQMRRTQRAGSGQRRLNSLNE